MSYFSVRHLSMPMKCYSNSVRANFPMIRSVLNSGNCSINYPIFSQLQTTSYIILYRILFDNLLKFNEPYNVNDLVLSNLNYTYNTNKLTVLFEINDYCRHFIYNILSCVSRVKTFLKILCDRSITVLQKHMKLFCNNTLYFTHVLFKFVVTDFYTILIKY